MIDRERATALLVQLVAALEKRRRSSDKEALERLTRKATER